MTVATAEEYKFLQKLGVPVHREPCSHVLCAELDAKLTKAQRATFSVLLGVQTSPVVPGGLALYAWDAEDVLTRMLGRRMQGSQLVWD